MGLEDMTKGNGWVNAELREAEAALWWHGSVIKPVTAIKHLLGY